ncbi:hypothetical protein J6524_09235 [Bradyrhizobium sp. WSM 1738]|uniref:hypothetical protein n=1 Tax=Bradyrhizobium hereditatis TaxID=2821405 RepID=UPI001CE339B0|nr:hypothetical protein [Bradyrhizobium hereditatis]MCA6115088.1 hypothetical protein [Bradyrhizobium hereditatis]
MATRGHDMIKRLLAALETDYIMLGGGNAGKPDKLPRNVRLGAKTNAFEGRISTV